MAGGLTSAAPPAVIIPSGTGALITDPALAAELATVLNQPQHLQPPALRHFTNRSQGDSPAGAIAGAPSQPSTGPRGSGLDVLPAVLVTALSTASALAVLMGAVWPFVLPRVAPIRKSVAAARRRIRVALGALRIRSGIRQRAAAALAVRITPLRIRVATVASGAVAVVALAVVATVVAAGLKPAPAHPSHAPVAATTPVQGQPATRHGAPAASASALARATAPGPWTQLVAIEESVAAGQQQLALEEDQIANLATSPVENVDAPTRGSGAGTRTAAAGPLAALLRAHESTVHDYQHSVQQEYAFYVAAAQNPTVRAAVTAAAATSPDASAVVTYDLQEVNTQLQQEQAIATAQAAADAHTKKQIVANAAAPKFTPPVGGVVSQGFGSTTFALEPSITYHGVFYTHFHTGIDITGPLDTPLVAAAPGRVILAGSSRDASGNLVGYGNYVVIDNGAGYITLFGHLDQLVATTGQLVVRGQEIGLLGSTGWSTGPHVHFEIRHNGDFVDPETLLGSAVRA